MNKNIDWKDVENKISLICYRFDNLASWHEDLAQELRLHAYYVSDNYYDLYRKAIDFWRKIQTRQNPEIPYFDLDVLNPSYKELDYHLVEFDEIVSLLRKEINRPGETKWDRNMLDVANIILDIILEDIDPRIKEFNYTTREGSTQYINSRLNLSWVSEMTGIGYKRVVSAMKFLEDTIQGLATMHKIEIPDNYLIGYYEK